MNSREKILGAVKNNQPASTPLPALPVGHEHDQDLVRKFTTVLEGIGGKVIPVSRWDEINSFLISHFKTNERWVNLVPELGDIGMNTKVLHDPHLFENVFVSIIKGHFGVAENGAVWVTEECMGDRALPFICEHLVLIIDENQIFPTLHEAYNIMGNADYNFGTYIAGPSKTADIEQSLVLGAHGPKSLILFLRRP